MAKVKTQRRKVRMWGVFSERGFLDTAYRDRWPATLKASLIAGDTVRPVTVSWSPPHKTRKKKV